MLTLTEGKIWKHHGMRSLRIGGRVGHDFKTSTYQQDKEMTFWFLKSVQHSPDKISVFKFLQWSFFHSEVKKKITISIGLDLSTCFLVTWAICSFDIINHSFLPEEEIRGSVLSISSKVFSFCLPHVRLAETSQPHIPKVCWELVCYMLFMK